MGTQHGNRHRRFEPPRDMRPGAPETLEALDAARVTDIARWAWESNGRVFQVEMQRLGGLNDVIRGDRAVIIETGSAVVRESEYGHE